MNAAAIARWAVRTDGDPARLVSAVRAAIAEIDPKGTPAEMQAMTVLVDNAIAPMKFAVPLVCLTGVTLAGCGWLPTAGPTTGQVIEQGFQDNQIRYDVVDVNSHVVATLLGQPAESFRTRFGKYGRPAAPKIGIGDAISVSIWEAAGGGLFGTSPTDHVSAGSRNVTIPEQVVYDTGNFGTKIISRSDDPTMLVFDGCSLSLLSARAFSAARSAASASACVRH